jgi:hypothetical protein
MSHMASLDKYRIAEGVLISKSLQVESPRLLGQLATALICLRVRIPYNVTVNQNSSSFLWCCDPRQMHRELSGMKYKGGSATRWLTV